MPAGFGGSGVFWIEQHPQIGGEEDRLGFGAGDSVLFMAFGGIGSIPLESGDGRPIKHRVNVYS